MAFTEISFLETSILKANVTLLSVFEIYRFKHEPYIIKMSCVNNQSEYQPVRPCILTLSASAFALKYVLCSSFALVHFWSLPTRSILVVQTNMDLLHTGKCIRRFGGIYAYCRYFIDRKWSILVLILCRKTCHMPKGL